jgi:hypothetical protein
MNAKDFVDAVREFALKASVEGTISLLVSPPGRKPDEDLLAVSAWFKALSETDQTMLKRALAMVAEQAVFGVMCILDGARVIEPAGPKGTFELRFIKNGHVDVLSGPDGELLHELL